MGNPLPLELQAAKVKLAREMPYMNTIIWSLNPVEVLSLVGPDGLGTMAVDKYLRLYWHPDVVKRWTVDQLVAVLYHECGHVLREHCERCERGSFHPILWNIAADAEINDDIAKEQNVKLPAGCIMPSQFGAEEGLLSEEYYQLLEKNAKSLKVVQCPTCKGTGQVPDDKKGQSRPQQDQGQQPQDGQGQGKEAKGKGGQGQPGQQGQQPGGQHGQGHGKGGMKPCPDCGGNGMRGEHGERVIPIPTHGDCGSIADGNQRPWEEDGPNGKNTPGVKPAEAELIRRQVAKEILEHSKSRGTIPAWMERWAKDKLTPKVSWRKHIQAAIRASINDISGQTDYSYRRPSRRSDSVPDVIMPTMRRPIPNVIVQIDTSGSMSDKMVSQAIAEVGGVLRALGLREITVLTIDAAVGFAKKVFDPRQILAVGGGGTDMGVGIQYVIDKYKGNQRPDLLVILTDCYTPWPAEKPPFRVIIGRMSDGQVPGWADKVIEIRENKEP